MPPTCSTEAHFCTKGNVVVAGKVEVGVVADDPDDNVTLACAVESGADYVVSGDAHLLNLKTYREIRMVTAREFTMSRSFL